MATATPAGSQPTAFAVGQRGVGNLVQLTEHRDRRNGYARPNYRGHHGRYYGPYYAPYAYYGPYYSDPYYYPYYRPYYGPSVSFSFGF